MSPSHGHGFGKAILFGEHFVVHSLPAIVAALSHTGVVTVERITGHHELIDNCIRFPSVPKLTWDICHKPIERILKYLEITTPLKITLHGNLPIPHSGIGSSAAHMVGLSRALNKEFQLNLSEEQINQTAYQGEKEIHGNPSGIDNTAATYGGLFWFKKIKPENMTQPITTPKPIDIVLVETGKQTDTKTVIFAINKFITQNPKKTKPIFEIYKNVVSQAHQALKAGDLQLLGTLMNKNQKLLQELTISCPELDKVSSIAQNEGALGAKLTGTGRGGLAIALTPGKELQDKVSNALKKSGYAVLQTTIAQSPPPAPENFAALP
ncbi:mevalonate kinase [Candidatus Dependentiae bacterium]|nr:mevalonate kinase [Candidatus Dependentiae bacterium]